MSRQLLLLVVGILLVGVLLIGAIWGWFTALAYLIGLLLFMLVVFVRYAMLKFYLKTYSLRTILYTNPFTAILYSMVDPHRNNSSSDLNDLFSTSKTQGQEELEELPPFRFK